MKRTLFMAALAMAALSFTSCAIPDNTSAEQKASPAATSASAPGQTPATRQRYLVTETRVKPGLGQAYQDFTKKETLPAYQKAGIKEVSYYTRAALGEGGEFVVMRPIESLKELDEPGFIVKALGEEGARAWGDKRAQMIVSGRTYIMQTRPELSFLPKPNEASKLAFVTRQSIAPGRSADFESLIQNDVLPIIKKTNPKGYFVGRVGSGGDTEMYHTVILTDSFAEYEKWAEALTREGFDKTIPQRAGIVMHRESAVYRFLPELSLPLPTVAQK